MGSWRRADFQIWRVMRLLQSKRGSILRARGLLAAAMACLSVVAGFVSCTPTEPPPTRVVSLFPTTFDLEEGDTVAFATKVLDAAGVAVTDASAIQVSISDETIARIVNGTVIGLKAGQATIQAASGDIAASATLLVRPPAVARLSIDAPIREPRVTQVLQLSALLADKRGRTLSGRTINWTSTDTSVVRVSGSGSVTVLGAGTATVTAVSEGKQSSVALRGLPLPVASVTVQPAAPNLLVGQSVTLTAQPLDSADRPLAGRDVSFQSANPTIASVSQGGVVTALRDGRALIIVGSEGIQREVFVLVEKVPVRSMTLSPASISLFPGQTARLTAVAKDSAGGVLADRAPVWTSQGDGASVSSSGLVSAFAPGTSTITATVEGKVATATVTVSPIPVASVAVSPTAVALTVNGTPVALSAVVKDSLERVLTGRTVRWSSSSPSVIAVSPTGVLTALAAGSATITATSESRSSTLSASAQLAVGSVVPSATTLDLRVTGTRALTATARDSSGNPLTRPIGWISSNASVAVVSPDGQVTGNSPGTTTILAASEGVTGSVAVTVSPIPVSSVSVTPAAQTVMVTQSLSFSAALADSANRVLTGRAISWNSSDPNVVSILATGVAAAIAPGTVTITATSEGKTGSVQLTVIPIPVASVVLNRNNPTITASQTLSFGATTLDSLGRTLTGRTVTWMSSDPTVASIVSSTGLASGLSPGTVTITGTSEGKSASTTLVISPTPVATVTVAPASSNAYTNTVTHLVAQPRDAAGNPLNDRVVTWESSNAAIATVDNLGDVRTFAAGTVTITAISEGHAGTATIIVEVPDPRFQQQPPGMTPIVTENFDDILIPGWSKSPSWVGRGSTVNDPTAPTGGSNNVHRFNLAAGFTGDNDAGAASKGWTPVREIYVSLWFRPGNPWQVDRIGNQKLFLVGTSHIPSSFSMFVMAWKDSRQLSAGLQPAFPMLNPGGSNRGTPTCAPGQWCHVELYMKGNTAGNADGILRYWLNGVLAADHSNMQYCQTCVGTFQGMNVNFVWGTTGDVKTQSDVIDYDQVYVSGRP